MIGAWAHNSGDACALITSADDLWYAYGSATQTSVGDSLTFTTDAGSYLVNMSVVLQPQGSVQINRAGYCSVAGKH